MKKYRLGMIGAGYWAKILKRYFTRHPGFDLAMVGSRHPGQIDKKTFNEIDRVKPEEILENNKIEVVIVATPIGTHYPLVLKALEEGKHVFCEKPLTLKPEDAEVLAKKAKDNDLKLFTDYVFNFSPAIRKMISLSKTDAVGQVKSFSCMINQLGRFNKHDVYWDLACHQLSILDMIIPLEKLKFSRNDVLKRDGITEVGLIYASSVDNDRPFNGFISVSLNHPVKERKIILYCRGGTLVYDMMKDKPLMLTRYSVNREESPLPRIQETAHYEFDEHNTLGEVVQAFYNVLEGKIPSNIERALKVTRVLYELCGNN